jgi:hypothetical protein
MVVSQEFEPPDLIVATVDGVLTGADQLLVVGWIRDSIRLAGAMRVLIVLERFAGWNPTAVDDSAWLRDDEAVAKMAIVGEPRWKLPLLTVMAQPIRAFPIEYFDTVDAARQWLDADPADHAVHVI